MLILNYFILAIILILTSLPLYFDRKNTVNISFFFMGISLAISYKILDLSIVYPTIFLLNIVFIPPIVFFAIFNLFIANFPEKNSFLNKFTWLPFLPIIYFIYLASNSKIVIKAYDAYTMDFGFGFLHWSIYWCLMVIFIIFGFIKQYKTTKDEDRKSIKNLLCGFSLFIFFTTLSAVVLSGLGIAIFDDITSLFSLFFLFPIFYSILKYRFIKTAPVISKSISTIFTYLIIFFTTLIPITIYQLYSPIKLGFTASYIISLIYIIIIGSNYNQLRIKLQSSAKRLFLKEAYDVEELALKIIENFTGCNNFKESIATIFKVLDEHMEISNVQVFFPLNYDVKRMPSDSYENWDFKNNKTIKGKLVLTQKDLLVKDCQKKETTFKTDKDSTSNKLNKELNKNKIRIVIPCHSEGSLLAFILVGEKDIQEKYDDHDLFIFNTIQKQIPATIVRLNKSLESAAIDVVQTMQEDMLPKEASIPNYDIDWHYQAAEKVGGDYYDLIEVEESGSTYIILGDTVDHGLASGIIALKVRSIVNTVIKNNPDISTRELNYQTNTILTEELEGVRSKLPVSIVFIKLKDDKITYSGHHNELYLYRAKTKEIQELDVDHFLMSIGEIVLPLEEFKEDSCELNKGDILFTYSDGIIEAPKDGISSGDAYGEPRTKELLIKEAGGTATDIKHKLNASLNEFTKDTYFDDFCYVILKKV
ncbi:hypothetical protein DID80_07550 [Candidatus Marinamargulisbacteria bacterium SCGC AAA071-K20]|nr:hypothetical protein DID80_07550 [Candidatus Marinamargulisbacteria bacterium SCGC AAA071-K20]